MEKRRHMREKWLVCFALITVTLAVYWSVGNNAFVNFDDPGYVLENPHVTSGLTPANVRWAFASTDMANWHPLTWLSHMADCQLYGLDPRGHHFTSVFLHVANALLLFLLLARLTGGLWRSAFVAALFALHPLHVESVAWVSERKDVLSTLFFMVTLLAYTRYAERPTPARYLPVPVSFALGLMAKPMLVTLPFVLLLLDYWPLGRCRTARTTSVLPAVPVVRLVAEKIPLFVLAAASSVITVVAQRAGGAVAAAAKLPFAHRLANAVTAYAGYLRQSVWPADLAAYYPFPATVPVWHLVGAIVVLGAVSVIVALRACRLPFLPVGWLWFLGTLIPAIGLVQVGNQAMADRYTYIPLIGIFIMFAWGVPHLIETWRFRRIALTVSAVLALIVFSVLTWVQIGYWRNSTTLFTHALNVTSGNFMAHLCLGDALMEQKRVDEAIGHFQETVRIAPDFAPGYYNLGTSLRMAGRNAEAIGYFYQAIQLNPDYVDAHYNLGVMLSELGKNREAIGQYAEAVRIKPGFSDARANLGYLLISEGKLDEGMAQCREAARLNPKDAFAHYCLGLGLSGQKRFNAAAGEFSESLRLNPGDSDAAAGLKRALAELNKTRP